MMPGFSKDEQYFWSIVLLLEALVILVGNVVALRIFLKRKFLISKSTFLLLNLTVADLLVGLSSTVIWFVDNKDIFDGFQDLKIFRVFMIPLASLCALAVVSIERALAVFTPFHHRVASNRYFFAAIGLSWVFFAVPSIVGPQLHKKAEKAIYLSAIIFLLVILTTSYVSIYIKMKFFPTLEHSTTREYQFKLSKTLFLTTVVSVMAWLPLAAIQCFIFLCGYRCKRDIPDTCFMLALVAQLSNSFLNLIVYSFRLPEFRKELKASFCRCSRRCRVKPSTRADAFRIESPVGINQSNRKCTENTQNPGKSSH